MATDLDFVVHLDTDKALSDERFAQAFLAAWLNHPTSHLRPERWGRSEPVRNLIASTAFEQLVAEWCAVALMFTRVSRPKMTVSVAWRKRKGEDPRPYPWDLVAWLAKNGGGDVAKDFLKLVITHFEPAFASLTTQAESRRKHFVKKPFIVDGRRVGTAEKFEGHHVLNTLPGIYWITYFGRAAVKRLGDDKLNSIPVGRLERLADGYLLTSYDDASLIGTETAMRIERQIIDHLGPEKFFDKTSIGETGASTGRSIQ